MAFRFHILPGRFMSYYDLAQDVDQNSFDLYRPKISKPQMTKSKFIADVGPIEVPELPPLHHDDQQRAVPHAYCAHAYDIH